MARKVSNGSETAFAYAVQFGDLRKLASNTGYSINFTANDNTLVYVTGISTDKCIFATDSLFLRENDFDHMSYARLLLALESDLAELKQMSTQCSRTALILEQRKLTPILRPKKHIPTLDKLGIQLYHHCLFVHDKIVVFIWDTREIQMVLDIRDTLNISKRMFHLDTDVFDNNEPLRFGGVFDTEHMHRLIHDLVPSLHPCLSVATATEELELNMAEMPTNANDND